MEAGMLKLVAQISAVHGRYFEYRLYNARLCNVSVGRIACALAARPPYRSRRFSEKDQ